MGRQHFSRNINSGTFGVGRKSRGRPKGSTNSRLKLSQDTALLFLRSAILKRWDELIDAKMDLAIGAWVMKPVVGRDGAVRNVRVYKQLPDRLAIEYCFDVTVGKPAQALQVSGLDGQPISLEIVDFSRAKGVAKGKGK